MKISPKTKKYITFVSMVVLAAASIPQLKEMLPTMISDGIINISAYVVLVGAYWVIMSETA